MRTVAERTQLAWERSALSPLTAGALLLAKPLHPTLGRALLAAANVVLALAVIGFGRRRNRRIRTVDADPDAETAVPDAGRGVVGAAVAATVIGLATAVLIAFQT